MAFSAPIIPQTKGFLPSGRGGYGARFKFGQIHWYEAVEG
jgi:hypothetical protein